MNRDKLIDNVIKISGLIVVFSFFSGWTFIRSYFNNFNIGLSSLDLPLEYYFSSSFFIITDIKMLILLASFFVYFIITHKPNDEQRLLILFDIIFIILLFIFSFYLSLSDANKIAQKNKTLSTTRLPKVSVHSNIEYAIPDNLRLLHMSKDRYFFIRPISNPNDKLNIVILKVDDVAYLNIEK